MAKRVLTIGTFDLFHVGHLELLHGCRLLAGHAGRVIVGVNADDFVAQYKGRLPVVGEFERELIVRAIAYVDETFIHRGRERAAFDIGYYGPDIIAVGDDWRDRNYAEQLGIDDGALDRWGIELVYIPRTTGVSSSGIRASLR